MAQQIRSFVENVNALANATTLATGDIVDDTQAARDIALAAAVDAIEAEANASASETLAHAWADKGHNNPVIGTAGIDAEFSAYHWSVEASATIGDPVVDDNKTSLSYTWSSTKLTNDFANKSDITHNHDSVYEPIITKQTAFNKNFITASGENGSADTVARSDHHHSSLYEPKRTTQGTAYNKDFGTTSGTVLQGDHRFDSDYMPLATINSAYNKNFVADISNPQAEEINRGNHGHKADTISYDNSGNSIITSSSAQGALTQLDSAISNVTIAESTFVTLLGHTQYTQTIAAQNTPTKLMMPLPSIQTYQNASNNSDSEITIDYATSVYGRPSKLIEGTISVAIKLSNAENFAVNIAVDGVIAGNSMKGIGDLIISQFITNLDLSDASSDPLDQVKLSVWLTNLDNTADAVVESANIVWRGNPEGALVASGTSVDHSSLTGTGASNGVHTTSDIQGLDAELGSRANKVATPVLDNVLLMDASGDLKDSGKSLTDLDGMAKVVTPTLDHIVVMDSQGQSKDGGLLISDLALNAGDAIVPFKVASSTADNEAVNQGQMNAIAATYVLDTDYQTFIARTDNPHSVTYTQTGASALVHTHAIADVTLLQDTLDDKYAKVVTPATNNVVMFGAGAVVLDSGQNLLDTLLIGEVV